MLWAVSLSHTLAHESGSLFSQALTLRAGTTRTGSFLRWATSTIRPRSVREDRRAVTSSVVVMVVDLLATRPSWLDVRQRWTS
jgi:hypothetical protein